MATPLDVMIERARREPYFLGSVLECHARAENLDDAALARVLGCAVADLARLRLCRAPRLDQEGFFEDVHCISAAVGIEPARLADVVKRANIVATLRGETGQANEVTLLMAARDREEQP